MNITHYQFVINLFKLSQIPHYFYSNLSHIKYIRISYPFHICSFAEVLELKPWTSIKRFERSHSALSDDRRAFIASQVLYQMHNNFIASHALPTNSNHPAILTVICSNYSQDYPSSGIHFNRDKKLNGIIDRFIRRRSIGRMRKVRVPILSKRSMSVDRQRGTELLSAGSMKPAIARNCLELAQSNYPHSVCTRVY